MRRLNTIAAFGIMLFLVSSNVHAQTYLINEDFSTSSGVTPPTGWVNNTLYSANTAGVDVWHFNNPGSRTVSSPIVANFAIFDGANYSPANGALENVALESPSFNTLGVPTCSLSFDYIYSTGTGSNCYIEVFDGILWKLVGSVSTVSTTPTNQVFDISQYARNNCNSKIRFRWSANDGGYWIVDNVKVFYTGTPNTTDARVVSFSPLYGACSNAAMQFKVKVKNEGTGTIGNFPVTVVVNNGVTTTTITQNAPSSIAPCSTATVIFSSTVNMSDASVNYNITAYSALSGDQRKTASDTVYYPVFNVQAAPLNPSPQTYLICGNKSIKVGVPINPGDLAFWYQSSTATSPFFTSDSVQSSALTADTTYYVETFRAAKGQVPPAYTLPGNIGYAVGSSMGMFFNIIANTTMVIDSFDVVSREATNVSGVVGMEYRVGPYQGFEATTAGWNNGGTATLTSTGNGSLVRLRLGGVKLNAGDTVGFYLYSTSWSMLFKSNEDLSLYNDLTFYSNAVHYGTKHAGGVLTGFSFPGLIYYKKPCVSNRVSVFLNWEPKPVGDLTQGSIFQGTFQGTSNSPSLPDVVKAGDTLKYDIVPPVGFTNANYGSAWSIVSTQFKTPLGGMAASDTLTGKPNASTSGFIRFIPKNSMTDSLFEIDVTLHTPAGCDSTITRYVYVAPAPVAKFGSTLACAGQSVQFIDSSYVLSGGLNYNWNFGDTANPSAGSNMQYPVYTYPNPGTYTVTLTVTTQFGYNSTTTRTITVHSVPVADFYFSGSSVCKGDTTYFTNTSSIASGSIASYSWDFGNSSTATTTNGKVLYNGIGAFTVSLVATSSFGCVDTGTKTITIFAKPVAGFSAGNSCNGVNTLFSNSSTLLQGTLGYLWDFGDGGNSNTANPLHNYSAVGSYNVKLVAISDAGCKDSVVKAVQVKEQPAADFSSGPGCLKDSVLFTNLTTYTGPGLVSNWAFGDGGTATAGTGSVKHKYSTSGSYTITLQVTGGTCSASKSKTITVVIAPTASFLPSGNSCLGSPTSFLNQTSNPSGGSINYQWDFGDNNTATIKNPTNTYALAGTYTIKLRVDANSCADSTTRSVIIYPLPPISFTTSNLSGVRHLQFTPSSTGYVSYQWDMGDGNNLTDVAPEHTYNSNGPFTVKLKVKDSNGCEKDTQMTVSFSVSAGNTIAQQFGFDAYPNPFKEQATIKYTLPMAAQVEVKVFDLLGRELTTLENGLKQSGNHTLLFNAAKLQNSQGVYIIRLSVNGSIATKQLIEIK